TNSRPKRIYAMEKKIDDNIDMPGIFFGLIEMNDGMLCSLETQWCLPNEYGQYLDVELEAMYEDGNLKYRFLRDKLSVVDSGEMARPDIKIKNIVDVKLSSTLRK